MEEHEDIDSVEFNAAVQRSLGATGIGDNNFQQAAILGAIADESNNSSSADANEEVESLVSDSSSESEGDSPNDVYTIVKSKKKQKKDKKREKKNKYSERKCFSHGHTDIQPSKQR